MAPRTKTRTSAAPIDGRTALAPMRLKLGAPIDCQDAQLGAIRDVIVDPRTTQVTHLVVLPPRDEFTSARLVPMKLARRNDARGEPFSIGCSLKDFFSLEPVAKFASMGVGSLEGDDGKWDLGVVNAVTPMGATPGDPAAAAFLTEAAVLYDRVPKGEVELARSTPVYSCDGHHVGHLVALFLDEHDRVTGFVLRHRRLWRHRDVEAPASAMQDIATDLLTLGLTRAQVRALRAGRHRRT